MCGRYLLTSPVEALRHLFMFEQGPNLMPRYNIARTQDVPIARPTRDGGHVDIHDRGAIGARGTKAVTRSTIWRLIFGVRDD